MTGSGIVGCGSGFNEILFQAASALGRTALDVALTDVANNLADAADQQASDDTGGEDDEDTDATDDGTGGGDTGGGSGDGGDVVGDEVAGAEFFAANGCSSCHCEDATGGCALSAPSLMGVPIDEIDAHLSGAKTHPLQLDVSAQELADLEAFFASIGG